MSESIADVYAGDVASADASAGAASQCVEFHIEADADPDAFFRIVGLLNLANRCPSKVSSMLLEPEGTLIMQVRIDAVDAAPAEALRRKLYQLTCMRDVRLTVFE